MRVPAILLTGLIATLILTGCASQPADMETGKRAYSNQDYTTAFNHYQRLAEFGVPEAKAELGKLYFYGRGTEADPAKALALFEEAAEAGETRTAPRYIPGAQAKVGALAMKQEDGSPPPDEGIKLLREAAHKGEPSAWFELGRAFEEGIGVEQNGKLADQHYARAGELGHGRAHYYRAQLYQKGNLVPQDIPLAVSLYEKAGQSDYPRAWQQLGKLYEHGRGVPADLETALEYYELAEIGGLDVAEDKRRLGEKARKPILISDLISDIHI